MAEPTINVVIVNHDSGGTILKVIQSVLEQGMKVAQIIIVDNASRQDDLNVVRQTFPMVEIIQLEKDHGLAVARNAGLKISKGDLVLILDDDIYLSKDSLQRMVQTVYETKAVVVCPRIVLYPQNDTIHFDGASIHFTGTVILNHSFQPITAYQPNV